MEIMKKEQIFGLLKFGLKKHIEVFVNEGLLYMNSINYFREVENDELRKDEFENTTFCKQADGANLLIEMDGEWREIGSINGPIISRECRVKTNIFCMYAIQDLKKKPLIDSRNFSFGDTYAILIDGDEFLKLLLAKAEKEEIKLTWGLVKYVDKKNYEGPMGPFKKFSNFNYQSEFRIVCYGSSTSPLKLRLGNLTNIVKTGKLSEVNRDLRII